MWLLSHLQVGVRLGCPRWPGARLAIRPTLPPQATGHPNNCYDSRARGWRWPQMDLPTCLAINQDYKEHWGILIKKNFFTESVH